jgi:hypothetical protein
MRRRAPRATHEYDGGTMRGGGASVDPATRGRFQNAFALSGFSGAHLQLSGNKPPEVTDPELIKAAYETLPWQTAVTRISEIRPALHGYDPRLVAHTIDEINGLRRDLAAEAGQVPEELDQAVYGGFVAGCTQEISATDIPDDLRATYVQQVAVAQILIGYTAEHGFPQNAQFPFEY